MEIIAMEGGLRVISPNYMGLYVPKTCLLRWVGASKESGTVALISQSGGNSQKFTNYATIHAGLHFSKVIFNLKKSRQSQNDEKEETRLEHFLQLPLKDEASSDGFDDAIPLSPSQRVVAYRVHHTSFHPSCEASSRGVPSVLFFSTF